MIQENTPITYTFAPNWYRTQCICFCDKLMYYASNYILYSYDLETRRVKSDVCLRKLFISHGHKFKDIKIHTITKISQNKLLIGLNVDWMVSMSLQSGAMSIHQLEQLQSVEYVFYHPMSGLLICDEHSICQYQFTDKLAFVDKLKTKEGKVKAILGLNDYTMVFYGNGHGLIWKQLAQITQFNFHEHILSVDWMFNRLVMLTKDKAHNVHILYGETKQPKDIVKDMKKSELMISYPKSMYEKVKTNQKSAMTIKIINEEDFIVTGKLGQIITINSSKIKNPIKIKPYSMEEVDECTSIWDQSKHYKEIYGIYLHNQKLYCSSTDQTLSIWQLKSQTYKHKYSLKFVTASTQSIFFCENDPKVIFILLKDSIIRSCIPLSEGSYFLNEYWKFTKKFKITKAICHPTDLGIMCMMAEAGKLIIYDIYEDRLMKLIDIGEDIVNITYEDESVRKAIEVVMNDKNQGLGWNETKLKINNYFQKQMSKDVLLLIQTKQRFLSIGNHIQEYPRKSKLQRIHNTKHWDGALLLSSKKEKNIIHLKIYCEAGVASFSYQLKYESSRHLFKSPKSSNFIYIVEYKGKRVRISKLAIEADGLNASITLLHENQINLQVYVDECVLDYHSEKAIFYSQKEDVLQLVNLQKGNEEPKSCAYKSRIECLSFYLEDYLIIGSKDQAIKIIQIGSLEPTNQMGKNKKPTIENEQI